MTIITKRQRTRLYIYKSRKIVNGYIQNSNTLQKARQFPLRFYIQKY